MIPKSGNGNGIFSGSDFNHLFVKEESLNESVFEVDCSCSASMVESVCASARCKKSVRLGILCWALEDAFEPGDIRKQFTILREGHDNAGRRSD